ncbi:hypothetical protein CIG19_12865 [Enterobacterales bacterium CwR94]|nr:hypothetical protein CIG19_12865 [Enterobacterales bacterium CwR94]
MPLTVPIMAKSETHKEYTNARKAITLGQKKRAGFVNPASPYSVPTALTLRAFFQLYIHKTSK